MDEVSFIISLLDDNWSDAVTDTGSGNNTYGDALPGVAQHRVKPTFIDIRSLVPQQGRRFDADSGDVVIVYEDSASITHPTIDWTVRNEEYGFTLHIRTLQPKGQSVLTFSRDRLKSLYQIVRYVLEKKGLRPSVIDNSITYKADLVEITGRSEANDRGKRLLGYKVSVTMKRFGRTIVS